MKSSSNGQSKPKTKILFIFELTPKWWIRITGFLIVMVVFESMLIQFKSDMSVLQHRNTSVKSSETRNSRDYTSSDISGHKHGTLRHSAYLNDGTDEEHVMEFERPVIVDIHKDITERIRLSHIDQSSVNDTSNTEESSEYNDDEDVEDKNMKYGAWDTQFLPVPIQGQYIYTGTTKTHTQINEKKEIDPLRVNTVVGNFTAAKLLNNTKPNFNASINTKTNVNKMDWQATNEEVAGEFNKRYSKQTTSREGAGEGVVVGMEDESVNAGDTSIVEKRQNTKNVHGLAKQQRNRNKGKCSGIVKGSTELVIATYVSGYQYQHYICLYIWFALLAYPDAYVAVYLENTITPIVSKNLDSLYMDRWCVEEQYKTDLSRSGHPSLMRFFLNSVFLNQFKYQYVGDVDIFILRETPSLVEQHVQHMGQIGLPYSNVDRYVLKTPDKLAKQGAISYCSLPDCHRMTGLHFFETKPYNQKLKHAVAKWERTMLEIGGAQMCKVNLHVRTLAWCDETLLYTMITESGLRVPTIHEWFRPHHGVHIRVYTKSRRAHSDYVVQLLALLHNHMEEVAPMIFQKGIKSEMAAAVALFLRAESSSLFSEIGSYMMAKYNISIAPNRRRKRVKDSGRTRKLGR
eukprot:CFRG6540T1